MTADGAVIAARQSGQGMGDLAADQFEDRFLEMIAGWADPDATTRAIVCGMAGAREGWVEAGYRSAPAVLGTPTAATIAPTRSARLRVYILAGVSQADPPDVMRGEETQIAGLMATQPDFDGWIVLPGTHTKWARVDGGRLRHFFTCMTGELFQLLGSHSILRRLVHAENSISESDWNLEQFDDAVQGALADPAGLTRRLFGLRARALLRGLDGRAARARLSGELIGAEVSYGLRSVSGPPIALIGADALCALYRRAFAQVGVHAETHSAEAMTLAGLSAAWEGLKYA